MPRSRSRSRDRRRRDKNDRTRSVSRDKKDYSRKRSRSRSHERRDNRDRDRDRDRRRRDRSRSRDRRDRHRSRSHERSNRDKHREKHSKERSSERKHSQNSTAVSSNSVKPIVIIASTHSKGSSRQKSSNANSTNAHSSSDKKSHQDHRDMFEISNEFSREGFEQFSRDHGIDFSNIETDEDREAVHEKMQELLKAHFAAQGIVYPPPPKEEKPTINLATGFANDGSFLEQFKRMQEEQKQQEQIEKKRQAESLMNLPVHRRRGGKILKTGVVEKTKLIDKDHSSNAPTNAWGMYIKEVQRYKGSTCDDDSKKTRPLVK